MPKTTYLARVSVVSWFVDDGRMAFICCWIGDGYNVMKCNEM
jgi:hypothetical protein